MLGDTLPKTRSQHSKQAVENEAATIPPTTNDPNLITGNASNKKILRQILQQPKQRQQQQQQSTVKIVQVLDLPVTPRPHNEFSFLQPILQTQRLTTTTEQSDSDEEQEPIEHNHSNKNNTATMLTAASLFDADLQDILNRVLKFDLKCTPPHDIVDGLTNYGCFTWNDLQVMDITNINDLYKNAGNSRVPFMGNSTKKLSKLLDFVEDNRVNNVPDTFLPSTYTPENLQEYC